jgi:hypothetical protein
MSQNNLEKFVETLSMEEKEKCKDVIAEAVSRESRLQNVMTEYFHGGDFSAAVKDRA